ncbi:unnamed protein product, partial [Amoebophrya sp. A120]|eukprot:GSA120T00008213001.1
MSCPTTMSNKQVAAEQVEVPNRTARSSTATTPNSTAIRDQEQEGGSAFYPAHHLLQHHKSEAKKARVLRKDPYLGRNVRRTDRKRYSDLFLEAQAQTQHATSTGESLLKNHPNDKKGDNFLQFPVVTIEDPETGT